MRRAGRLRAAAALLVAVPGGLAGCGGEEEEPLGERPDIPTTPPALWNPCNGLDPAAVSTAFGTTFTARTGTPTEPVCSFVPRVEGEPAVDVNYQLYPGTLDDLLGSFGQVVEEGRTEVLEPQVRGADEARVIADVDDGTLAVTGFVRNGRLVQVVNALDPTPSRRGAVLDGVEALLGDLAVKASDSGLSD